ncbi:hypothetical protein SBV1_180032 [Verrucomicrobia bacterium]|nr:hypothetical protein SBV1_180032 [Verrucomicrobiota bacterium]
MGRRGRRATIHSRNSSGTVYLRHLWTGRWGVMDLAPAQILRGGGVVGTRTDRTDRTDLTDRICSGSAGTPG